MKRIIPMLLLFAMALLINFSCRKHESFKTRGQISASMLSDYGSNDYDVSDTSHGDSAITYTVLGDGYTNPFKSDIIMQAWNNLSENDLATPPVTHRYVKFTPQTEEQLVELIETGLPLFDFPLDYEIETLGHVWQNSAMIPEMYTYMPVNETMPGITHQVLYDVCFLDIASVIMEEAFDIAGLGETYPYDRSTEANQNYDNVPNTINEHFAVTDWGTSISDLYPYAGGIGGYNNGGLDFNTPTPNDVSNHCNCGNNDDDREPSGCVLVEETQFAPHWSGVRDVKIDLLGPFSQYMRGSTSQTGCFSFSRKMRYKVGGNRLPVHMRVSFKSHEVTIRSALPAGFLPTTMPAVHNVGNVAQFTGLNWIRVRYHRSRTQFGLSTAYYSAASLNNAHYEYKDMSWQDGILPPHSDMHYLVHPYGSPGEAAAPMLRQLIKTGHPTTIIQIGVALWVFGGLPVIGGQNAQQYLALCPPDIAYNTHQGTNWDNFASDRIKEIMYHELGHATHYRKTDQQFWLNNIAYVAGQSVASMGAVPYGDGTAQGWDRCALVEMWGYHIGRTYTHRRYGINHSGGGNNVTDSWLGRLERQLMWYGFIPVGLLHDLMDNNIQNLNVDAGLTDNAAMGPTPGTQDDVAGFTNLMLYNELGSNSQNIFQWRDNVRNNQLPATWNSTNVYNTLVGIYGL